MIHTSSDTTPSGLRQSETKHFRSLKSKELAIMFGKVLKPADILSTVAVVGAVISTDLLIVGYRLRMTDRILDIIFNLED